ncbi:hypothetical protein EVB41_002 [Rhizobium phage RHph_TM3_14A]|nr:hypothetical protein EVB29_002 [Rhizobium phage RHph_TM27A]QIG66922.1 hypothetical protein EVB30_002 [Rhizobium phage RHph_TM27B]QIG67012.1 hypothetical protein EVB31_002 [Rhizobium phage RHph_TM29]QIG67467.1 hypothetical protein EVB41_002 [Rhizobium phage RHph_TM3_14A]
MTWLAVLKLALQLVAFLARQADKRDIESAALDKLENLNNERVRDAAVARDDVLSGRVQPDDNDPNRRD